MSELSGNVIAVSQSPLAIHLKANYPVLNEATSYLLSYSILNTIASLSVEYFSKTRELIGVYAPVVNSYIDSFEAFLVSSVFINFIDVYFPVLKSIHLSDLSIHNLYLQLSTYLKSTIIYIKALEIIDQSLKYINPKLSTLISIPSEESNSLTEVDKFVKISKTLLTKFKSYPTKVQIHVKDVYNDEFSKNNQNSIKAIASTSNQLTSELSTKLQKGLKQIKSTTSTETTTNNIIEPTVEPTVEAITTAVESINGNGNGTSDVTSFGGSVAEVSTI